MFWMNFINSFSIMLGVLFLAGPLGWQVAVGIGLVAWGIMPIAYKK